MADTHPGPGVPPGWYPGADGSQLYWDGVAWTEHVAAGTPPSLAHVTAPAPPPPPPPLPGGRPGYGTYPVVAPQAASGTASSTHVIVAWILTLLTGGYLLPWAIAATRRHPDVAVIAVINVLLGWTIVGWVIALLKAVR